MFLHVFLIDLVCNYTTYTHFFDNNQEDINVIIYIDEREKILNFSKLYLISEKLNKYLISNSPLKKIIEICDDEIYTLRSEGIIAFFIISKGGQLFFSNINKEKTMFKNIFRFPPASLWKYHKNKWEKNTYWNINDYTAIKRFFEDEIYDQFNELFKIIIKLFGYSLGGALALTPFFVFASYNPFPILQWIILEFEPYYGWLKTFGLYGIKLCEDWFMGGIYGFTGLKFMINDGTEPDAIYLIGFSIYVQLQQLNVKPL